VEVFNLLYRKKAKVLTVILTVVLAFALAACGTGQQAATPAPEAPAPADANAADTPQDPAAVEHIFRLAETNAADHPTNIGNMEFARVVEELSGGRIIIELFPAGQLGDETAVVQELVMGTIDFGRVSVSPVAEFSPGLNAMQLPFLYRDAAHMWAVLNGPIGADLLAAVESAGLVGLTWYDSGSRNFYTNVPLATIDDFPGVRIRMMDSRLMMGIVEAFGGSPIAMGLGEVYGALQTGVIDGAENNIIAYEAWSHYEVAPYLLKSGHLRIPEILMGSMQVMDRLSAEDQEIIRQAAYQAQLRQREYWIEREVSAMENVLQNPDVVITEMSSEEWQRMAEAVAHLHAEFGAGHEELIEQIINTR